LVVGGRSSIVVITYPDRCAAVEQQAIDRVALESDGWLIDDPARRLSWGELAKLGGESEVAFRQRVLLRIAACQSTPLPPQWLESSGLSPELVESYRGMGGMLAQLQAPVDRRIADFLEHHLGDLLPIDQLAPPKRTLVLDRHGLARTLSLPWSRDDYTNRLVSSYRVANGVLHNPDQDRRTTQGTFHVAEGGLPIPADKRAVPRGVFARLLQAAWRPPAEDTELPIASELEQPLRAIVSLLLRPLVCPPVPGYSPAKTMEVRFFAPGSLVSNLDFVESIFGNAGDPLLPTNDAGLDLDGWTGHTGCVILAPHLTRLTKRALGLPPIEQATDRQRRDGMCWSDPDECYNGGQAFKVTCRTAAGVIVTLIADNYFGYCKKEVKTQISYAANLGGQVEEEHAGGALAMPSYALGDEFQVNSQRYNGRTFADVARDYADFIDVRSEGYGIDRIDPRVVYIPENARASLYKQRIHWQHAGHEQEIRMEPGRVYMAPSGYRIRMERHPSAASWRLIGTAAEAVICHKPCTVSGGGKSEISKSIRDYILSGPIFVSNVDDDFDSLDEIFARDYSDRWLADSPERPNYSHGPSRPLLDPRRSLGSVIKLLTPSRAYTPEYNAWLESLPNYLVAMALIIKRFCKPEWQGDWRAHFSVDQVNGQSGHELKYHRRQLVGLYLRIGLDQNGRWQTYKLRQDYAPAAKILLEDDITASRVVPGRYLSDLPGASDERSYKFVANSEYRLFQRPDDCIHRGLDRRTEAEIAQGGNFFCNFQPLTRPEIAQEVADVALFDEYTPPMRERLEQFVAADQPEYVVSSAVPRLVDGLPTKNPRYLQDRPDLIDRLDRYSTARSQQLFAGLPIDRPLLSPVSAVLCGRRNNPPDPKSGFRSLAVYSPIHYQELPELLMDFVCSLTGKSPSTTGAGSEGAMTKGPFNALLPVHDLNTALVSYVLTGLAGMSSAAGHIGPQVEVGHDISMLIPELWCRLKPEERDPEHLAAEGLLERLEDFTHDGRTVLASRLGYRITRRFVRQFLGRIFDNPSRVLDDHILRPETQDMESFVDGIHHIIEAQQRVARAYFEDGSYELAVPPLKVLLEAMADPETKSERLRDPSFRSQFTRPVMLAADWYRARLVAQQQVDVRHWERMAKYLARAISDGGHGQALTELERRRTEALVRADAARQPSYLETLVGTLGVDPSLVVHEPTAASAGQG
jgi:phosphoenolpyruvate carboxykinase (diphosphate)